MSKRQSSSKFIMRFLFILSHPQLVICISTLIIFPLGWEKGNSNELLILDPNRWNIFNHR